MKVIVLTTSYNCEDYIERSLATIMTQTYKNFKCYITKRIKDKDYYSKLDYTLKGWHFGKSNRRKTFNL